MAFKVELNSGTSFSFNDLTIEAFMEQVDKGQDVIVFENEGKKYFLLAANISAVYEV